REREDSELRSPGRPRAAVPTWVRQAGIICEKSMLRRRLAVSLDSRPHMGIVKKKTASCAPPGRPRAAVPTWVVLRAGRPHGGGCKGGRPHVGGCKEETFQSGAVLTWTGRGRRSGESTFRSSGQMAKAKGKTKSRKGGDKRATRSTKNIDIAAVRQMITRMVTHQAGDM